VFRGLPTSVVQIGLFCVLLAGPGACGRPSRAAAWSRRWHCPSRPERRGGGAVWRTRQAGPPPPSMAC